MTRKERAHLTSAKAASSIPSSHSTIVPGKLWRILFSSSPSFTMDNNNNIRLENGSKVLSRVSEERVGKAVDSLLKWVKSKAKHQKSHLLDYDELLYLVVTLKKIPGKSKMNPYKIPLPHPLFRLDGTQEICLIINDREKGLNSKIAKERVREEGLPISKVLKFSKLKTDYRPFEAKRKLCGSFDLFLADKSAIPFLPKSLGKSFFKKKKHPIPVDLRLAKWRGQIESACGSAFLYIASGTCSVVKVARISQTRQEIVENVMAVIEDVASLVPRKWKNIRSLHLKSLESLALPLYQSAPEMPLKLEGVKTGLKMSEKKRESKSQKKEVSDAEAERDSESKPFKKGRIHDVRYMDHTLEEDLSEDVLIGSNKSDGNLQDSLGERATNAKLSGREKKIAGRLHGSEAEEASGMPLKRKERSGKMDKEAGAKRRKDFASEGKAEALNDQTVNDARPSKKKIKIGSLEDGTAAGKDEAPVKKEKKKTLKKKTRTA